LLDMLLQGHAILPSSSVRPFGRRAEVRNGSQPAVEDPKIHVRSAPDPRLSQRSQLLRLGVHFRKSPNGRNSREL